MHDNLREDRFSKPRLRSAHTQIGLPCQCSYCACKFAKCDRVDQVNGQAKPDPQSEHCDSKREPQTCAAVGCQIANGLEQQGREPERRAAAMKVRNSHAPHD